MRLIVRVLKIKSFYFFLNWINGSYNRENKWNVLPRYTVTYLKDGGIRECLDDLESINVVIFS